MISNAKRPADPKAGLASALARLEARTGHKVTAAQSLIPPDMTFREWCEKLGREGLKVDGKPFRLDNRPAMAWVYDQLPSTVEAAYDKMVVLMKCTQVGFTLMEILYAIYAGIKFMPCFVGMYLPDMKLAAAKSTVRFLPVIRTIPDAYKMLTSPPEEGGKRGEGNVMIRQLGDSRLHFLWTSGKAMTESFPIDILSYDEVQEMLVADIEKTAERLGGSVIKFQLMGSTANWPDADIDHFYRLGQQWEFWTECPTCGVFERLTEAFPRCIQWDTADDGRWRYSCVTCGGWINNPQRGEWRAAHPEREIKSIQFPQFLSPTHPPGLIMRKWKNATNMQNFYNRTLGRPYSDPSTIPVNLEMLNECARQGMAAGVKWKTSAKDTYMGVDQMGQFNVVLIKERLPDGRQALIYAEETYSDDPFMRASELMEQYGVAVCVVETLPNYNDAKRFAARHLGRVFLAGYAVMKDEMLRWGDAPRLDVSERRTDESERDRYTVILNQYKCMQVAMARIAGKEKGLLFPDPDGLTQIVKDKKVGERKVAILRERVFLHLTKTALVVEKDEEEKKYTARVVKIQIDPHFSYANMLCDVAWARAHGTSQFILQTRPGQSEQRAKAEAMNMHGLSPQIVAMLEQPLEGHVCGRCSAYDETRSLCNERNLIVRPRDPGCALFIGKE